jgi:hypothetical protein
MRKGIEPKGFCPNWFSDELPQLWKINWSVSKWATAM